MVSTHGLQDNTHWTHYTAQGSYGRVISSTQRPLSDNTQQSQKRDTHGTGGIRTRNPSKRAAADSRRRRRGYLVRIFKYYRRSGDRIPMETRYSALVQTGHGAHSPSYKMGTVSLLRVMRSRCDADHTTPRSVEVKERIEL